MFIHKHCSNVLEQNGTVYVLSYDFGHFGRMNGFSSSYFPTGTNWHTATPPPGQLPGWNGWNMFQLRLTDLSGAAIKPPVSA